MSQLLHNLEQLLERQITDRGIVVWYDPDKAYEKAVDRKDLWSIPVKILREVVINALVHADYSRLGTPKGKEILKDEL